MRRSGSRFLLWGLLAVLGLLIVWVGVKAARLWPHVRRLQARASTISVANLSDPAELARLRVLVGDTQRDLQAIRAEAAPFLPLAGALGWLPGVGGDLQAAPALLDMAIHLSDAGWWALLGAEPVADALAARDHGVGALEAALPALTAARPRFAEAERALAAAKAARVRVDARRLSPRLAPWVERLDRYLPSTEAALQLAQRAPALLGAERPLTYLLLAQNNHELRPTGGFISGVGVVRLEGGRITGMTFEDSYRVDAGCEMAALPPAPAPLRRYMWAPALVFRDANWSPDFPSSAATAASIYRLCRGEAVDGIVAVDLEGVAHLLGALGPLQPEGYPEPVTRDTLLGYVAEYWTAPLRAGSMTEDIGEWWSHRKDFMADLLGAAIERVAGAGEPPDAGKLAPALLASLRGKHLLISLADPEAARALSAAGWDGSLRRTEGDCVLVVDANVGYRKVNPQVAQSIDYRVDLSDPDRPQATLTLRYHNRSPGAPECVAGSHYDGSYGEMMQGCYWDYVRVYAPRGSRLLALTGADGGPDLSEELGRAVFGAYLVVPPGGSRELVLTYALPPEVLGSNGTYRLLVQKQPGSAALPVQVTLTGEGWQPEGASGQPFALEADTQLCWRSTAQRFPWPWALLGGVGVALCVAGAILARPARPR